MCQRNAITNLLRRHGSLLAEDIAIFMQADVARIKAELYMMRLEKLVCCDGDAYRLYSNPIAHIGRCRECGQLSHYLLDGHCPHCQRPIVTTTEDAA